MLHAAIIWVWLQVNFEGAIFAGRKKSAKTSKFKRLENKALTGILKENICQWKG